MWSAEHSISSGDSPRNSGLLYGNLSGRSELPGWSPLEPPAIIPPMKLATADFTRVSMVVVVVVVQQRGSRRCDCVSFPPRDRSPHGDAVSRRERQTQSGRGDSFSSARHSVNTEIKSRTQTHTHIHTQAERAARWSCDKPVAAGGFGLAGTSVSSLLLTVLEVKGA